MFENWKTALLATDVLPGDYYPNYTILIAGVSFLVIIFFVIYAHRKKRLKQRRQSQIHDATKQNVHSLPIFIASLDTLNLGSRNRALRLDFQDKLDSPDKDSRMSPTAFMYPISDTTHGNPFYHSDTSIDVSSPTLGSLMSLQAQRLPAIEPKKQNVYEHEHDSASIEGRDYNFESRRTNMYDRNREYDSASIEGHIEPRRQNIYEHQQEHDSASTEGRDFREYDYKF